MGRVVARQLMMMMMMLNKRQSNKIGVRGGGKNDGVLLLLLLLMGARGLEHIGDVFSSCQVMIGMTQQIIYYGIGWDEIRRPPFYEDIHNNQPKTARQSWRM